MTAVRIVHASATALAAKRQAAVAILNLCKLFDFFLFTFRNRGRLNIRQITVYQIPINKLLSYQVNCTNLMSAQN